MGPKKGGLKMARDKSRNKDFWSLVEEAEANNDLETIDRLLSEGFVETNHSHQPFSASIEFNTQFREDYFPPEEGGFEAGFAGGLAIDAANAAARARRRIAYNLKTAFGFNGIRLVEDGDSWTQYPIFLKDIVDQLSDNNDIAIYSVGAAGDLITNMAAKKEYIDALHKTGAQGIIISGAGNDLFGDFGRLLNQYQPELSPKKQMNAKVWKEVFDKVIESYETIISDIANEFPGTLIFGHGYDLPYPEEDGSWIGPPLIAKDIPLDVGRDIVKVVMDRFNSGLNDLAVKHSNFIYNDLRGVVDKGRLSWYDELHPKNTGYQRAAGAFESSIRQHLSFGIERAISTAPLGSVSAGVEHHTSVNPKTIVLDPGHGGSSDLGGSSWNNAVGPNGTLEKTLTLDIAKRTRDILQDSGFNVKLTRESDVNLSLKNRAKAAKDLGASAFISIHFNGSVGHNAQGTETFVHSTLNSTSEAKESKNLCLAVQAEMVEATGLTDRNQYHPGGIKLGSYGVLRPSRHSNGTAAILHEVSFLDRADEEIRLNKVSYRRKIARALADGIETYIENRFSSAETFMSELEIGDAIELAAFEAKSGYNNFSGQQSLASQSLGTSDWPTPSNSNGHMIADVNNSNDGFLHKLANYEAQREMLGNSEFSALEGEGNEPSEYDPLVEQTFSRMGNNPEYNFGLLRNLFGEALPSSNFEAGIGEFNLAEFQAYIESLNLQYFSATEFLVKGANNKPGGKGEGLNTNPPRHLWKNIGNTAKMLDEIRKRLNAPVYILSVYRSLAYNTAIDGASSSRHMEFDAIDWHSTAGSVHDWLAVSQEVRDSDSTASAAFNGWMKAYTDSNFVHIDTRHRTINL